MDLFAFCAQISIILLLALLLLLFLSILIRKNHTRAHTQFNEYAENQNLTSKNVLLADKNWLLTLASNSQTKQTLNA